MQIQKMFAIYDKKATAYRFPHFLVTVGQAIREFQDAVNNPQTEIARHPADFALYHLGDFNDSNGNLQGLAVPAHIEEAINLKTANETK